MANGRKTGGRTKGTPNRHTASIKQMILNALEAAGGEKYLTRCAVENPAPFLALLGRILPTQQEHSGSVAMGLEAIDRPPPETREEWVQRRQRELDAQRKGLANAAPMGNAD